MKPIHLPANSFEHFYAGGSKIARFRGGHEQSGRRRPEDWVASTTARDGTEHTGLSELPDGRLLRDAVAADPVVWLGAAHHKAFGDDTSLLVKLLDTDDRLIVHTHPSRDFAREHLGCAHGKTEAWVILETTDPNPLVYLGFRQEVSAGQLQDWVLSQRTDELLAALNEVPVKVGDVVLVPAGVPHAIGAGIFIAEVQEPTDFSLTLEWLGYDLDGANVGHLGLGFDLALQSVDRSAWPPERVKQLFGPSDDGSARQELLPAAAAPFFRIERIRAGADLEPSFAVVIVTAGAGTLITDDAEVALQHGETLVVPYAAGAGSVAADVTALRFLPPRPDSPFVSAPVIGAA